MGANEFEGV
jgi:hypothetical protein